LFSGSGNAPGQPALPVMAGPGVSNPAPLSAAQNPQHFESPRRAQSYRQTEELHIPSMSQHGSHQQSLSGQQIYHSPQEYSAGGVPGINLQQATSQEAQYSNTSSGNTLPSTLQPGGLSSGRPGPLSTNTAPSSISTMHQLASQQQQQYSTPSRSGTFNSHSHSRSSPAGFDNQKYGSMTGTPSSLDSPKYVPHKYTAFHSQQSPLPNSAPASAPLGLADIRPRTDTGTSDPGANPYSYDGSLVLPTNSNYLAPWAIYAFDWCKWPVQQQGAGAGKVAVGSYLEDGHNFVSSPRVFKGRQNSWPGSRLYTGIISLREMFEGAMC
jgi:WD repeat-containing protein 68